MACSWMGLHTFLRIEEVEELKDLQVSIEIKSKVSTTTQCQEVGGAESEIVIATYNEQTMNQKAN